VVIVVCINILLSHTQRKRDREVARHRRGEDLNYILKNNNNRLYFKSRRVYQSNHLPWWDCWRRCEPRLSVLDSVCLKSRRWFESFRETNVTVPTMKTWNCFPFHSESQEVRHRLQPGPETCWNDKSIETHVKTRFSTSIIRCEHIKKKMREITTAPTLTTNSTPPETTVSSSSMTWRYHRYASGKPVNRAGIGGKSNTLLDET